MSPLFQVGVQATTPFRFKRDFNLSKLCSGLDICLEYKRFRFNSQYTLKKNSLDISIICLFLNEKENLSHYIKSLVILLIL